MSQNSHQSLSSDSSSCIIVSSEPSAKRARMGFACNYCNQTFPTAMALGGHQNAHRRVRALGQRPAGTSVSYQPSPTIKANHPLVNSFPPAAATSATSYGLGDFLGPASPAPQTAPSGISSPVLPVVNYVPPGAGTSATSFGFQDFFAASSSSAAPNTGESGMANVINLEDEEEGEDEIDLELRL